MKRARLLFGLLALSLIAAGCEADRVTAPESIFPTAPTGMDTAPVGTDTIPAGVDDGTGGMGSGY